MSYISADLLYYEIDVPSQKKPGELYKVVFGLNQFEQGSGLETSQREWSCTCPDFQYRGKRDGHYCKHIESVQALDFRAGGQCSWTESKSSPAVYFKEGDEFVAYAPFKRHDGTWVKAVYIPDEPFAMDGFTSGNTEVVIFYVETAHPKTTKALMSQHRDLLNLININPAVSNTGQPAPTTVDEDNIPVTPNVAQNIATNVTKSYTDDDELLTQPKPAPRLFNR